MKSTTMTSAKTEGCLLKREHMLGCRGNVRGAIQYLTETSLLFVTGQIVVIFDTETKKQSFIAGSAAMEDFCTISISPCRRMIAIGEKGDEMGSINLYDSKTLRRRKFLSYDGLGSQTISHISFSNDSKICAVLGGAPSYNLSLRTIDKPIKIITSISLATPSEKAIYQADFCPSDSSLISITGDGILRFFRIVDNCFRPITVNLKRKPQDYTCHCWLPTGLTVVIGTSSGELLFVDGFQLSNTIHLEDESSGPINCIQTTAKRIFVGCEDTLYIYHLSDGDSFTLVRRVKLDSEKSQIVDIALAPSEESLTIVTSNNQIFSFFCATMEMLKDSGNNFNLIAPSFHSLGSREKSAITGLDSCVWRPIIATCGLDRAVRIWNYHDKTIDVVQYFDEDIHDISLHPCGLQLLICCTSYVGCCSILVNELKLCHQINVQSCQICSFSHGGQYFALAYNAFVQIYDSLACETICTLRGHSMKIISLSWKSGDDILCTMGSDGVVCTWRVPSGEKLMRKVEPLSSFICGEISPDFAFGYIASAQHIKQIDMESISFKSNLDISCSSFSSLARTHSKNLLFAGISKPTCPGILAVVEVDDDGKVKKIKEWNTHSKKITKIHIINEQNILFTVSEDGSLCCFQVEIINHEKDGGSSRGILADFTSSTPGSSSFPDVQKMNNFLEEALVSQSEFDEKRNQIETYRRKIEELKVDSEHQLKLKETDHQQNLSSINNKFQNSMGNEKEKYEQELIKQREKIDASKLKVNRKKSAHEEKLLCKESQHNDKMNAEAKMLEKLLYDEKKWNQGFEEERQRLKELHTSTTEKMSKEYEDMILWEDERFKVLQQRIDELIANYNKDYKLLDDDAEMEIAVETHKNEEILSGLQSQNMLFAEENGIMKKRYDTLLKDLDEQKETIASIEKKRTEILKVIYNLDKVIDSKEQLLEERDSEIKKKNMEIEDIEKQNEELRRINSKLIDNVRQVKREMEPRENEISSMNVQTKEMDFELENYLEEHDTLDQILKELRMKHHGIQNEITRLDKTYLSESQRIVDFVQEFQSLTEKTTDYTSLKAALLPLFRKYLQS